MLLSTRCQVATFITFLFLVGLPAARGEIPPTPLAKALKKYVGPAIPSYGAIGGRPTEFFSYTKEIRDKVKSAWRWRSKTEPLAAQVQFRISPNGDISDVHVVKPSGDMAFDDSVVRAVYESSPLPPPPKTAYRYFEEVKLTFDGREQSSLNPKQ